MWFVNNFNNTLLQYNKTAEIGFIGRSQNYIAVVKNKDKLGKGEHSRDVLGRKKLHLNVIPIDFATLFATCNISDQFRFSSKISPRKFVSFTWTMLIIYNYLGAAQIEKSKRLVLTQKCNRHAIRANVNKSSKQAKRGECKNES